VAGADLKQELERLLNEALKGLEGKELTAPDVARASTAIAIERTRDASHGDFSTNVAMKLAKSAGLAPRALADAIVRELRALPPSPQVAGFDVAGAGFINFRLAGGINSFRHDRSSFPRGVRARRSNGAGATGESSPMRSGTALVAAA